MSDEITINDFSSGSPRFRVTTEDGKTIIRDYSTNAPRFYLDGEIGGGVKSMTTAERTTTTPKDTDLIYDVDDGKLYIGDNTTPGGIAISGGGGGGGAPDAGYRQKYTSGGSTINFDPYADIVTVTGASVTLQPDTAYKIMATTGAVNITANPPPANQWAYEGHAEIFVGATGYAVFDTSKIVLANQLEPDSVNNCTLRFHDGMCYVSVEDHIAGYVVVSATGTTAGTLPFGITSATQEYVAFDASLNGSTIDLSGSTASAEKHVVGNGYTETAITGAVDCGTSKFTVANLSLSNVQVTGGVMTLGDAYIPNGSTVAVSGGALAVEKVTGNGGVIDLGGERVIIAMQSATIQNVTLSNGKYDASPAAIYVQSSGSLVCNNATFTDNIGSGAAIVGTYRDDWSVVMSGCSIYGNTAKFGGGIDVSGSGTMNLVDCFVKDNTATNPSGNNTGDIFIETGATVIIDGGTIGNICENSTGNPQLKGHVLVNSIYPRSDGVAASVTLTSGAILDLTGNTNPTPIAPGGDVIVDGGCTVINSAGASVSIAGGTYTKINNDGTTE